MIKLCLKRSNFIFGFDFCKFLSLECRKTQIFKESKKLQFVSVFQSLIRICFNLIFWQSNKSDKFMTKRVVW